MEVTTENLCKLWKICDKINNKKTLLTYGVYIAEGENPSTNWGHLD